MAGITSAASRSAQSGPTQLITAEASAMAFAMAGVPQLMPNQAFAMATNYGTFESKNGMALAAALRLTEHVQVNAGIGYGFEENIVDARAGLRIGF